MYLLVEFELKVKQCEEPRPRQSPGFIDNDDMKHDFYETLRDELRYCPKGRMLALGESKVG